MKESEESPLSQLLLWRVMRMRMRRFQRGGHRAGRTARGTARDVRRRAPAHIPLGRRRRSAARSRGTRSIQMGPKARDVTSRRRRRFANRAGGGTDAHAPTEARATGALADALTAPMRRAGTPTEAIAAIAGEGQATVRARAFWVRAGASRTLVCLTLGDVSDSD